MKREIKFRAWDIDAKEMLFTGIDYQLRILSYTDEPNRKHDYHIGFGSMDYQWFNLMQYTGLKDANGVEIYSDDLLKDLTSGQIFRIYDTLGGFAIKSTAWAHILDDLDFSNGDELILMPCAQTRQWIKESCEVIGNIYTY